MSQLPDYRDGAPRRLTHAEARDEQLRAALKLTMEQRLYRAAHLTRQLLLARDIDLAQSETDWTPSRVRRSPR